MVKYMEAIQELGESCDAWQPFRQYYERGEKMFDDGGLSPATAMTYTEEEKKQCWMPTTHLAYRAGE